MSSTTTASEGSRVISAFFDTVDAGKKAIDDLIAGGIPSQHITRTDGHDASTAAAGGERGFWAELKNFFMPDQDRSGYAEGLRRGGCLVAVRTDESYAKRVMDTLDRDGAVDMDQRESQWRSQGWTPEPDRSGSLMQDGPASGLAIGTMLSAGAGAVVTPRDDAQGGASRRDEEVTRAATLDQSVAATAIAARTAARDDSHGRSRLRSYILDDGGAMPEAPPGSFSPKTDGPKIVEHMDVISADGQTIGQVDHLDGPDRIKLTKASSPDGEHHFVPFAWIDHVDAHVHLSKTLAEIKAGR